MLDLIAIAYADETVAGQAAGELERCAEELSLDPDATSVVVCERDGGYHLTSSRRPGATAAWSKFWGSLLGVVVNDGDDGEIDPVFRHQVMVALAPGTSILFVAPGQAGREQVVESVSQFGGTVLCCPLADDLYSRYLA